MWEEKMSNIQRKTVQVVTVDGSPEGPNRHLQPVKRKRDIEAQWLLSPSPSPSEIPSSKTTRPSPFPFRTPYSGKAASSSDSPFPPDRPSSTASRTSPFSFSSPYSASPDHMYASPAPSDRPLSATEKGLLIRPEHLVYISPKGDPRDHGTVPAQTKYRNLVNEQWLNAEERAHKGEIVRVNLYNRVTNPREWAVNQELVEFYKIQHP